MSSIKNLNKLLLSDYLHANMKLPTGKIILRLSAVTHIKTSTVLILFFICLYSCKKDDSVDEVKTESFDKPISAIAVSGENVWIGTPANGLYKFDGEFWKEYTRTDGLLSDTITSLVVDENEALWIGTNMGVSRFKDENWTNFTTQEGLFNNDIRSLTSDQQNSIWIGTRNNRLIKYDGNDFTSYHVNPEASGQEEMGHIHTITCDLEGNVWAGSCISGLSKFDGINWEHYVNDLNLFVLSSICAVNGDVWIGHYTGAYRFSDEAWTHYTETEGLINNQVTCFAVDRKNNIWIGTSQGLSMYDGSVWINYTVDDGLISNYISALACDFDGNIWIGSAKGPMLMDQ